MLQIVVGKGRVNLMKCMLQEKTKVCTLRKKGQCCPEKFSDDEDQRWTRSEE
jgi:hypothetical protein